MIVTTELAESSKRCSSTVTVNRPDEHQTKTYLRTRRGEQIAAFSSGNSSIIVVYVEKAGHHRCDANVLGLTVTKDRPGFGPDTQY